jgi:hypothetical protein
MLGVGLVESTIGEYLSCLDEQTWLLIGIFTWFQFRLTSLETLLGAGLVECDTTIGEYWKLVGTCTAGCCAPSTTPHITVRLLLVSDWYLGGFVC